jgi:transposase-like protein
VLECTAEAIDMAQRDAEKLRRELDRVEGRQGRCFPPELKLRAARWIAERRASGARVAEIAAELGLAEGTVLRWSRGAKPAPSRALVPVEVVPDPVAARTVTAVSPSGFRIDGLSLLEAAALLRAVG